MTHPLDEPIAGALKSRHAHLAEYNGGAMRYKAGMVPFIAGERGASGDMSNLFSPSEQLINLQRAEFEVPPGLVATLRAKAVQMTVRTPVPEVSDTRIVELSDTDTSEMVELANLTRPGPFTSQWRRLGRFWGIRLDGRLAAMAGQRLAQDGFIELSGVCVHPDFQGKGLGRTMSCFVASEISAGGDKPFLHAYASNEKAIGLYETIGFEIRAPMNVTVLATSG